jgi:hypothetical protein
MIAFIDDHRGAYGVEPICKLLPIAPSTYHAHVARRLDPSKCSARAQRDEVLRPEIERVFAENFEVYGARTERLAKAGIEPSVGSVGDSYDNALAETINGLYKAEVIHRRGPWRSFEPVEFATLTWIDWFNHRRLLEPIGNIPPAEAEERYYAMIGEQQMAA